MKRARVASPLAAALLQWLACAACPAATLGSVEINGAAGAQHLQLLTAAGAVRARLADTNRDLWQITADATGVHLLTAATTQRAPACAAGLWAALAPSPDTAGTLFIAATVGQGTSAHSLVAAVSIDHAGTPRLEWTQDQHALPGLGLLAAAPTPVWLGRQRQPGLALGSGWPPAADPTRQGGALLLLDAGSGAPLAPAWLAPAPLPGGITALDLDADGATDRLYLADATAQVWRLELRAGAAPTAQVRLVPQLLTDLAGVLPANAALLFAPDVVPASAGARSWLELGFVTSNRPGSRATSHALLRVRDALAPEATPAPAAPPFVLALPGPAAGPPLTVAAETHVAIASAPPRCSGTVAEEHDASEILTLRPAPHVGTLPVTPAATPGAMQFEVTRAPVPAAPGATLQLDWQAPPGEVPQPRCVLGSLTVPCRFGPTLTRDYWLRRDAP